MQYPQIICTLGPSCKTIEQIKTLNKAGADIFRVNMSHADLNELEYFINIFKDCNIQLGIDTEGAQIRTKLTNSNYLDLKPNDKLVIQKNPAALDRNSLTLYPHSVNDLLEINMQLRLDFNGALIKIEKVNDTYFDCTCLKGGVVANNKGVDVINRIIELEDFTEKDIKALKLANQHNINNIFISFCKSKDAIIKARKIVPNSIITSKIESKLSINNLPEILEYSDNILIDRGDLSREINIMDIPFAQRAIIDFSKSMNKPCFIATNVLESLINLSLPTRAELNDIISNIEMGASGIVLAAETAIGLKPLLCVEIVKELIHRYTLHNKGLLFADIDRQEITDQEMRLWLNRSKTT